MYVGQFIRVDEYTYFGMKLTVFVTSLPTSARLWLTQMQVHRGNQPMFASVLQLPDLDELPVQGTW